MQRRRTRRGGVISASHAADAHLEPFLFSRTIPLLPALALTAALLLPSVEQPSRWRASAAASHLAQPSSSASSSRRIATPPPRMMAADVKPADALELHKRLTAGAKEDTSLGRALSRALRVLRDALRLYGADGVVTSFNGGKDAVVILQLMRAALAAHNEATGGSSRLRVIFFEMEHEFPEVDQFVRDSVAQYDLDLVSYAGVGFAQGLERCIAQHGSGAFVLGTRGNDPNAGGQEDFAPSSDWMPPFMRVNPILTWSYADVWAFLRVYELPYCALYDEGYTSLGKTTNTQRNPALLRADGSYGPAWQLTDGSQERAGRVSSDPTGTGGSSKSSAASSSSSSSSSSSASSASSAATPAAGVVPTGMDPAPGRVPAQTAGLLLVGDEILGGKITDENTRLTAKTLRTAGVTLRRVCVVPDELEDIVEELRRLMRTCDVVLTSGGVGPTHDDITLKAVASALDVELVRSEQMAQTIIERYAAAGRELPAVILEKMATLPAGAITRQIPGEVDSWPILQCANVFVLPGVPTFFAAKLTAIASHFLLGASPLASRRVRLAAPEESIVRTLNTIVTAHPDVTFGSYPISQGTDGDVQTVVTLETAGSDALKMDRGLDALLGAVPKEWVVEVSNSTNLQ